MEAWAPAATRKEKNDNNSLENALVVVPLVKALKLSKKPFDVIEFLTFNRF